MSPKSPLSRRTLLRGTGTLMALPMLEAMLPRHAQAQAANAARRMVAFYVPCGMAMSQWTPAATGSGYALSPILSGLGGGPGLASVKEDVLVLSGLSNAPAKPDGEGDHASGTAAFITAVHPNKSDTVIRNGISMDQVAANAWLGRTRFASLELGTDGGGTSGDCDSGYSCAYARNISWASETQPLAKEVNPAAVFNRLFGVIDPDQTATDIAKRKKYKLSVLDSVKQDSRALSTRLGTTDRRKLDEFMTGVRALELRVNAIVSPTLCQAPSAPTVSQADVRGTTTAMLDLIAFAFQCDLTRVGTFMIHNCRSDYTYNFLCLSSGHHDLSHHGGKADKLASLAIIDRWEVDQFAYLLRKLKSIQEPDGTVLDNSLVFFSSEVEDGNTHSHDNMPILLGGRGGKKLNAGRHLKYAGAPPVAHLFLIMRTSLGVAAPSYVNSPGRMTAWS